MKLRTLVCFAMILLCGVESRNIFYKVGRDYAILKKDEAYLNKYLDNTVEFGGSMYYFSSHKTTWDTGEKFCQDTFGSHLTSIHTTEERDFLGKEIKKRDSDRFYVGLRKQNNKWTWTDGTPFNYQGWAPGEPSGDGPCGELIYNDKKGFNDRPCSDINNYVCKL